MEETKQIPTAMKTQILQEVLRKTRVNFEQNKHEQDEQKAENLLSELDNL